MADNSNVNTGNQDTNATDIQAQMIAEKMIADEDTCMHRNYDGIDVGTVDLHQLIEDIKSEFKYYYLGLCGCGSPELVCMNILTLLKSIDARLGRDGDKGALLFKNYGVDVLSSWVINESGNEDWCKYMVLYSLTDNGFLEHGTSIFTSWVTDRGKDFIYIFSRYPDKYTMESYDESR